MFKKITIAAALIIATTTVASAQENSLSFDNSIAAADRLHSVFTLNFSPKGIDRDTVSILPKSKTFHSSYKVDDHSYFLKKKTATSDYVTYKELSNLRSVPVLSQNDINEIKFISSQIALNDNRVLTAFNAPKAAPVQTARLDFVQSLTLAP